MPDPTTAYVNGQYLPREQASLPLEDRGTLFADGVYEVIAIHAGQPFLLQAHLDRLHRSLDAINLPAASLTDGLPDITHQLIQRSAIDHGIIYWQITRGPAPRNHLPPDQPNPSISAIIYPRDPYDCDAPPPTRSAALLPDQRWARCCVKSLMLLPNTLALQHARQLGSDDAILHRDGRVTEASASNVMLVRDNALVTPPADDWILAGITRALVIQLAGQLDIPVHQTPFDTDALRHADEILLTGTTTHVAAVTHLDGQPIADATPGPITQRLHHAYRQHLAHACQLNRPAL